MPEFILGFPTGKAETIENLTLYTNMQDATVSTSYSCGVYHTDLEKAKAKFMEIYGKANASVANPGTIRSVLDVNTDNEKAAKFLRYLYDRMCAAYENNGLLGNALLINWDEGTLKDAMETALSLPNKKLTKNK